MRALARYSYHIAVRQHCAGGLRWIHAGSFVMPPDGVELVELICDAASFRFRQHVVASVVCDRSWRSAFGPWKRAKPRSGSEVDRLLAATAEPRGARDTPQQRDSWSEGRKYKAMLWHYRTRELYAERRGCAEAEVRGLLRTERSKGFTLSNAARWLLSFPSFVKELRASQGLECSAGKLLIGSEVNGPGLTSLVRDGLLSLVESGVLLPVRHAPWVPRPAFMPDVSGGGTSPNGKVDPSWAGRNSSPMEWIYVVKKLNVENVEFD